MTAALDFNVLDAITEKRPAKSQQDASKAAPEYKTITDTRNAPQVNYDAVQSVQKFKHEISNEIKAGMDPYPLLLKAVQLISSLTGDKAFYSTNRDVMQGMNVLKELPAEWERDSAAASLDELETARRNIDKAIEAHKQFIAGQLDPVEPDAKDEYKRRIKKCFVTAYRFLDENKHARTDEDWTRISGSFAPYKDPLTIDLLVAVVGELEREYKEAVVLPVKK